jgi:hypothetical protein
LVFPSDLFPSAFHIKTLFAPLLFPYVLHAQARIIIPDLIIRLISGEQYGSLSSSLCGFFPTPPLSRPTYLKYPPQNPIPKSYQPTFLPLRPNTNKIKKSN